MINIYKYTRQELIDLYVWLTDRCRYRQACSMDMDQEDVVVMRLIEDRLRDIDLMQEG